MNALAEVKPGYVTNDVHPGDPVQQVSVTGFATAAEATRFVEDGFVKGTETPVFETTLLRGASARFAGASFLVFFRLEQGTPRLLSLTRCHEDLRLVIHSCGFQFLLGVNTSPAPVPAQSSQ